MFYFKEENEHELNVTHSHNYLKYKQTCTRNYIDIFYILRVDICCYTKKLKILYFFFKF